MYTRARHPGGRRCSGSSIISRRIEFGRPFSRETGEWRFFYRDFFSMFLRWTAPIRLLDGTLSREPRLMRRRVRGQWQYRALQPDELSYILGIENGTHC